MIGAIVINDIVENVIVIDEQNVAELEAALNCEIIDARPHGLAVGDLRTAAGWTRNAGGEQIILPLLEQQQYDSYTVAMNHVAQAEQQAAEASNMAVNETLMILTGEVDE